MPKIDIVLFGRGGELDAQTVDVPTENDITAAVIKWLTEESVLLAPGDQIEIWDRKDFRRPRG